MDKTTRQEQFHLRLTPDQVGEYVLLPGDPGRCESIARLLDDAQFVQSNREFTTWTGSLLGEKVSVVSTGIGGPSAVIALEELVQLGANTFIRVGTCGGISPIVYPNDLVIATGAVRMEGTSREYAPPEFPAVPNFDVVSALVQGAIHCERSYHTGIIQSKDSFYGQHAPQRMPIAHELEKKWDAWKRLGVLASEMESAALMVAANALHVRMGSVLHVIWNQEQDRDLSDPALDTTGAIQVAVDAVKTLIRNDLLI